MSRFRLALVGLVFLLLSASFFFRPKNVLADTIVNPNAVCETDADCDQYEENGKFQAYCGATGICQITQEEINKVRGIKALDNFVESVNTGSKTGNTSNGFYTNYSMDNLQAKLLCGMVSCPIEEADGSQPTGAIQAFSSYIAYMYDKPPATTDRYVADLLKNLKIGIASPAYAQGLGFASLEPVLEAWKKFRNVAYLFLILVMLTIGFMIMLRQKMGQAAVTAQQAIPQVVIALITITFSYAIAGLLIDFMYLLMYLMIGLFGMEDEYISMNIIELGYNMFKSGGAAGIASTTYHAVSNFVGDLTGSVDGGILDTLSGLTAAVIVAIAILFAIFKLFFELLKTYVSIIISVVLSPLILMMGALPGKNVFWKWVKGILGNLIAFPTVLMLLIISRALTETQSVDSAGGFLPPYLIGRGSGGAITTLIGLSILLIMSDLVVQAKKAIGGQSIFEQFGSALAGAVKKGWEGGQLFPGVGLTDTRKMGMGMFGSGKDISRVTGVTGAALTGGLYGAGRMAKSIDVEGLTRQQRLQSIWGGAKTGFKTGVANTGAQAAVVLGEKRLYKDQVALRKAEQEKIKKEREKFK